MVAPVSQAIVASSCGGAARLNVPIVVDGTSRDAAYHGAVSDSGIGTLHGLPVLTTSPFASILIVPGVHAGAVPSSATIDCSL
jgi:hypothetical protein